MHCLAYRCEPSKMSDDSPAPPPSPIQEVAKPHKEFIVTHMIERVSLSRLSRMYKLIFSWIGIGQTQTRSQNYSKFGAAHPGVAQDYRQSRHNPTYLPALPLSRPNYSPGRVIRAVGFLPGFFFDISSWRSWCRTRNPPVVERTEGREASEVAGSVTEEAEYHVGMGSSKPLREAWRYRRGHLQSYLCRLFSDYSSRMADLSRWQ
jgi:hypothetical protein